MADTVPNSSRPPAPEPMMVGPYELVRRLGAGGMAEAWLARKRGLGGGYIQLCLKLIRPHHANDPQFVAGFRDEARVHGYLRHPHIVTLFDSGREEGPEGRYWLAMEYVDGGDLRTLMRALEARSLRLPYRHAAYLAFQVTQALEHAHGLAIEGVPQNLVHRDVSPSNILLSLAGHAKLSDFGIVKAATRDTHTESGIVKGKFTYLAPEFAYGKPYDGRADLFALGVILYEIFTGRHPYHRDGDESELAVVHRAAAAERPPIRPLAPHVPAELCDTVDALLEPDPDKRVPNASALLERLAPHVANAVEAAEISRYIKAVRDGGAFPTSAIQVAPHGARISDALTRTHSAVVSPERGQHPSRPMREATPSELAPDTAQTDPVRSRRLKRGAQWALPLVAVAVAAALALRAGPREAPRPADTPEPHMTPAAATERAESPAVPSGGLPTPPATDPQGPAPAASPTIAPQTTATGDIERATGELGTPDVDAHDSPAPDPVARPTRAKPATPSERRAAAADEARQADAAEKNAWLYVRVRPSDRSWNVWVDGQYCGVADVRVKVTAGRHVVEVGVERPTVKRVTRVNAGQTRDVQFEF